MYNNEILGEKHLKVLNYLKEEFMPDAVIAGGAVRDQVMDKPFTDVDILFFTKKPETDIQQFFELKLPKDLAFREGDFIDIRSNITIPPDLYGDRHRRAYHDWHATPRRPLFSPNLFGLVPQDSQPTDRRSLTRTTDGLVAVIPETGPRAGQLVMQEPAGSPVQTAWAPLGDSLPQAVLEDPLWPEFFQTDDSYEKLEFNGRRQIQTVINFFYRGVKYQFIRCSISPIVFCREEFDVGFCKIMHDGERVIKTNAFDKDQKSKTLTIHGKHLGPINFKWAMERHIPRLQKKYPDFRVNVVSTPDKIAVLQEKEKLEKKLSPSDTRRIAGRERLADREAGREGNRLIREAPANFTTTTINQQVDNATNAVSPQGLTYSYAIGSQVTSNGVRDWESYDAQARRIEESLQRIRNRPRERGG